MDNITDQDSRARWQSKLTRIGLLCLVNAIPLIYLIQPGIGVLDPPSYWLPAILVLVAATLIGACLALIGRTKLAAIVGFSPAALFLAYIAILTVVALIT